MKYRLFEAILWFFSLLLTPTLHAQKSDTTLIYRHLNRITKTDTYRHFMNIPLLDETAEYILQEFTNWADTVFYQTYELNGQTYRNVIAQFKGISGQKLIVGAHYDVCGMQQGADDNASGVVGLLELARLMNLKRPKFDVELVAYTLEEPPYFRTEYMGSYVHAQSLVPTKNTILGMVSLEMIGYFSEEKKSQSYPLKWLRIFYGQKGNFITLVNKWNKGKFARKFTQSYRKCSVLPSKRFAGPKVLPGVDFSDHLNYWKFGFSALMLTDTAFYRNKHYHEQGDTMEKLNLTKMAHVIDGLYQTLLLH
jgi:hypothetical protein